MPREMRKTTFRRRKMDKARINRLDVNSFFDEATFTVSYVVSDPETRRCAIVDSVLDYNPNSARTSHTSADQIIEYVRDNGLKIEWILETHVHADHLSA